MADVDVLVVAGAWALGSAVVSLGLGAVVSRADHGGDRRRRRSAPASGPLQALPLALSAPRASVEQVTRTAS